jgi:hypothetical protein
LCEIRVEHLRDYLAARDAGVLIASLVSRRERRDNVADLGWGPDTTRPIPDGRWKGFHRRMSEIPMLGSADSEGYYVEADLRRNEWLEPGTASPRVRGDDEVIRVDYIIKADGTRAGAQELLEQHAITPLFFRPTLGRDIVMHPKGVLSWDTRYTGTLGFEPFSHCRFSVNDLGLISVIAVDVAGLPLSLQQRLAAHNITPEGGIAEEAFRMWFEAKWVGSEAPENRLVEALTLADQGATAVFGKNLYRAHPSRAAILSKCSRFRALDADSFRTLAKDVCRVAIDDLDLELFKQQTPEMQKDAGSLKRLQAILTSRGADGYTIMGPLFAVYELRQDDAHLPSDDRAAMLEILGAVENRPWVRNGEHLLDKVASTLMTIDEVLQPSNRAPDDGVSTDADVTG